MSIARLPLAALMLALTAGYAAASIEPPALADRIAAGTLPPLAARLPERPSVVTFAGPERSPGHYGGELRMLMSQPRDTRMMVVYGYARLVGYDTDWKLKPDLLAAVDVEEGRRFTLRLRKGHRWSDGHPFTAEDFRFYWQDVANNEELSPGGPDRFLRVDGEPPTVEIVDEVTVRYTWKRPNPYFLPALAGARPEYVFVPAHYARRFHAAHVPAPELAAKVAAEGQRNWAALFTLKCHQYRNDNPELPTLEPWQLATRPPSTRFVFVRNPFYHRVDSEGRQLPYIDTVSLTVTSPQLIPAKTAAGEADLQARSLSFENFTILKQGEARKAFKVHLWKSAHGAEVALLPNLNVEDPTWKALLRSADFRRALSLAINRTEVNQVLYYGLAREGNDTVLPESPLFRPEYENRWAAYDPATAGRLLDGLGLSRRGGGIRTTADGRPLEIVVETAGEDPIQVAILQLIGQSWANVGVRLLIKTEEREVLRNRVFAGLALMSVWYGLENALPTAATSPHELAPTSQMQLYWPKWGQYQETRGRAGAPVDLPEAAALLEFHETWLGTLDQTERTAIWHRMLGIRAEQVFTIGTVRAVPQPVVVSTRLRNVPREAVYNWEPGAHFGVHRPDTFWFAGDR
jgi:peptide/nickel transport system substrate-binding protein